jgi:hypothetical protein
MDGGDGIDTASYRAPVAVRVDLAAGQAWTTDNADLSSGTLRKVSEPRRNRERDRRRHATTKSLAAAAAIISTAAPATTPSGGAGGDILVGGLGSTTSAATPATTPRSRPASF